jgi:hypothetical protein
MLRLGGLAALAVVLLACASPARADREFSPRFSAAATGDIAMAANVLLSCRGIDAGCANAQAAAKGASLGNNAWEMQPVDVDADPATFDSSSATLALPAGATVLFAGLYWGASTSRGTHGAAAPDVAARGRARLTPPGGAAVAVTAARVDDGSARSQAGAYQAFADVTATVRAAGPGTYTLANVQTGTGLDRYAGWALVVAYSAPGAPSRDLTVFDGFLAVNDGDAPHELSVSGFRTPRSGPVRTRVGFVAYEGDRSQGGDGAAFNGTPLGDAASPANNFFNSTIALPGGLARTPDYANQLGYDARRGHARHLRAAGQRCDERGGEAPDDRRHLPAGRDLPRHRPVLPGRPGGEVGHGRQRRGGRAGGRARVHDQRHEPRPGCRGEHDGRRRGPGRDGLRSQAH